MMEDIVVVGAGKWGSALAYALSKSCNVYISSRTPRDLPNFIPISEALKFKYIVMAIATQHIDSFLKEHFSFSGNEHILIASKGIDVRNGDFLDTIYKRYLPVENFAFLSGPSFAVEVLKDLPTAVVVSSVNGALATSFSNFFPRNMKTYVSNDIVGSELAGAYKNPLAIASGIVEGLKFGENARASLLSRGITEMVRFTKYFGAKEETIYGLSGAGDLFLTASSTMSRNYRAGIMISEGKSIAEVEESLKEVAEGIPTTKAIYDISRRRDIYVPIVNELYCVLYEQKSIRDSLKVFFSN